MYASPVALDFRILGPLEVHDGDRLVRLGGDRQRALLALLLLRASSPASALELAEALWPDAPLDRDGTLQVLVHRLRRSLGDGVALRRDAHGYALDVGPDGLDAARFEALVRRARGELATGDDEAATATLREALAAWRGPALADVVHERFAEVEAARLDELRLCAEEDRVEAELRLARHAALVAELEALADAHPTRERLQAALMLALYRSGRQAEALERYRRARVVLLDELGLEPGPALRALEGAILRQDRTLDVEAPHLRARRHLPAPATPLVGRRGELDAIATDVRRGARLLTLTGPGGIGKTRLAVQAAHELAEVFDDGVWFVALDAVTDPALVPAAIAGALGVEVPAGRAVEDALRDHLRPLRLLVVVDSFEVVDDAAPLVADLLAAASGLVVLATSRAPLRLYGEHERAVPPLDLEGEAVPLFVARARARDSAFRDDGADRAALAEICRRLDCLPLAIELAAARTRGSSPRRLAEDLPGALELASGARDLPARQRTLRATIAWSYDLLRDAEQALFDRLAVFPGGGRREDVRIVCDAADGAIDALLDQSLARERRGGDGETRVVMLATVREYAAERLAARGEADARRERHAERLVALAEEAEADYAAGRAPTAWLDRFDAERDNVRAALAWAHGAGCVELELRLASALRFSWQLRGRLDEGLRALDRALGSPGGSTRARARALYAAGVLRYRQLDLGRASACWEAALPLFRELGDAIDVARCLGELGNVAAEARDYDRARELLGGSTEAFRAAGDELRLAQSIANLGDLALRRGELGEAAALLSEAAVLHRRMDDEESLTFTVYTLAVVVHQQGDAVEARRLWGESLAVGHAIGYPECVGYGLSALGVLDVAEGAPERGAPLLALADALFEGIGAGMQEAERARHDEAVAAARAVLGDEAYERAAAEGRAMPVDDAVALALAAPGG